MTSDPIKNLCDLQEMLDAAIQLEHATIPPYLTALYSLYPQSNIEATQVIRAVLVEEMLHMTLVANLLNSLDLKPNLLVDGFIPDYPTYLPSGETDFQVSIAAFTPDTLKSFLQIERPQDRAPASNGAPKGCVQNKSKEGRYQLKACHPPSSYKLEYKFYSIGEFYEAILDGIKFLECEAKKNDSTIFSGDPKKQIGKEYYYSGGGNIVEVFDLNSACEAIRLIQEQGEGYRGGVFDHEGEVSHYYRFQQLELGQFYHSSDQPNQPTGEKFEVDYDKVYPVKKDPKLSYYHSGSDTYIEAINFNNQYKAFLSLVNKAYNGEQDILLGAVCDMFRLKESANQLIRNPIPGSIGVNAGPTFEIYQANSVSESTSNAEVA